MSLEVAVESCRLQVKEYTQKGTKCNFKCLRCDYLGRDKSDCRRHLQAYPGCLVRASDLCRSVPSLPGCTATSDYS